MEAVLEAEREGLEPPLGVRVLELLSEFVEEVVRVGDLDGVPERDGDTEGVKDPVLLGVALRVELNEPVLEGVALRVGLNEPVMEGETLRVPDLLRVALTDPVLLGVALGVRVNEPVLEGVMLGVPDLLLVALGVREVVGDRVLLPVGVAVVCSRRG
jgi:hypothetical protein